MAKNAARMRAQRIKEEAKKEATKVASCSEGNRKSVVEKVLDASSVFGSREERRPVSVNVITALRKEIEDLKRENEGLKSRLESAEIDLEAFWSAVTSGAERVGEEVNDDRGSNIESEPESTAEIWYCVRDLETGADTGPFRDETVARAAAVAGEGRMLVVPKGVWVVRGKIDHFLSLREMEIYFA